MKSNLSGIFFSAIVLAASLSFAKSSVRADHSWERTSDKYTRQIYTLKYWKQQWNFGYNYPDEKESDDLNFGVLLYQNSGQVPGQTHTGQSAQVLLAKKINPNNIISGAFGFHNLKVDQAVDPYQTARGNAYLKFDSRFYEKNDFNFYYENDYHYAFQLASGSARTPLTSEGYGFGFTLKPLERIRFLVNYSTRWVSEGVQRQSTEGNLVYGISPSWPWIWVGVGGEYMSHSRTSPSYYSPQFFKSYGTRAEAAFPIFSDDWTGALAWNYSIIQEATLNPGTGHYIVSSLKYGGRQNLNLGFNYTKILSQQSSSQWESENYLLHCEYPF